MKPFWRIVVIVAAVLLVVFVIVVWGTPIALSYYWARRALPIARIVPSELSDHSVSTGPVEKLAYFGYEFEIPWTDLDQSQTKLLPNSNPQIVDLHFHSGLRIILFSVPPGNWVDGLARDLNVRRQKIAASFGTSDYEVERTMLEFTPDKMSHWSLSQKVHAREQFLLLLKTAGLMKSAESGIFNIRNSSFKGFQQGDPSRRDGAYLQLFDDKGSIELVISRKDLGAGGVKQSEINRIIASLRRIPIGVPGTAGNVKVSSQPDETMGR